MNKEVSQVGIVALFLKSFVSAKVWCENDYLLTLSFYGNMRSFKVILKYVLTFLNENVRKVIDDTL